MSRQNRRKRKLFPLCVRRTQQVKKQKNSQRTRDRKKTVHPAETAVRKGTAMETEEARTVRTVETETAEMEIVRTAMETVRRESAASTITETARTAAETVREETAITAEEAETVREAEDHSVSVPHVQTEADREIMAEDRSQERMMIPRIRTAVREETAAEPSIRALQAIQ